MKDKKDKKKRDQVKGGEKQTEKGEQKVAIGFPEIDFRKNLGCG